MSARLTSPPASSHTGSVSRNVVFSVVDQLEPAVRRLGQRPRQPQPDAVRRVAAGVGERIAIAWRRTLVGDVDRHRRAVAVRRRR